MNRLEFDSGMRQLDELLEAGERTAACTLAENKFGLKFLVDEGELEDFLTDMKLAKGKYINQICPVLARAYRTYCEKELGNLEKKPAISLHGVEDLKDFVLTAYRHELDGLTDARKRATFEKTDMTIHKERPGGMKDLVSYTDVPQTFCLFGEIMDQFRKHKRILLAFTNFDDGERIKRDSK